MSEIVSYLDDKRNNLNWLNSKIHVQLIENKEQEEIKTARLYCHNYTNRDGFITIFQSITHEYQCLVALIRLVANLNQTETQEQLKLRLGIYSPSELIFSAVKSDLNLAIKISTDESSKRILPEKITLFLAYLNVMPSNLLSDMNNLLQSLFGWIGQLKNYEGAELSTLTPMSNIKIPNRLRNDKNRIASVGVSGAGLFGGSRVAKPNPLRCNYWGDTDFGKAYVMLSERNITLGALGRFVHKCNARILG